MLIRSSMISKMFYNTLLLITIQCGLVFSVDQQGLGDSNQNGDIPVIPLSTLLDVIRREHHEATELELGLMLIVASSGDRLYNLPINLSTECSITARASLRFHDQLATCQEVSRVIGTATRNATRDFQSRSELKEHPLEPVCRLIEKQFAENANLSSFYEKVKKDATNFEFANSRPPHFRELIKSKELILKFIEKSDVPEIANFLAHTAFCIQSCTSLFGYPPRPIYFTQSCIAVAKKERFADSMQSIYNKVIKDVLPEIMASDRVEKFKSAVQSGRVTEEAYPKVWIPSMVESFYRYIGKDPILIKEVEDMAAIVSKGDGTGNEYLEFSKLCYKYY